MFSRVNSSCACCKIMRPAATSLKMSSGDTFQFTKLNGQNYGIWAVHMENTLSSKYLSMVPSHALRVLSWWRDDRLLTPSEHRPVMSRIGLRGIESLWE